MNKLKAKEWAKVTEAFEHALSLDGPEQVAYLQKLKLEQLILAEEVEKLLLEDKNLHPVLKQSAAGIWQHFTNDQLLTGKIIGPYKLASLLGSGAMGSVFAAERIDKQFIQTVALKLIRQGVYSNKSETDFRKERQILANLQHPNIANLFDGGVTEEGRPWFTMELIEGKAINEYCLNYKLTTRKKVELFLQVCSAVQYAHANLVIHLDLKPSNILVNKDGLVKVLDFGVAHSFSQEKYVSPDTEKLQDSISYQFTLGYAAPEQIKGMPVNTACDIYAAGTILFELLSGSHPYQQFMTDSAALSKAILTLDPPMEENLDASQTTGKYGITKTIGNKDLEAICKKALAKDPKKRYASMEALRADIEYWLYDYPVVARKGGKLYAAGKYLKRHRWPVTVAAIGIVILSLTIGWYTTQIKTERDVAIREAIKSDKVLSTMLNIFSMADPNFGTGEDLTAVSLLKNGTVQMEADLKDQPEVLCMLLRQMTSAFNALSVYKQADTLSAKALHLSLKTFPLIHKEVAAAYALRGSVFNHLGEYDSSLWMHYKANDIYNKLGKDSEEEKIFNLYEMSVIHYNRGEYMLADSIHMIEYALNKKRLKPPHRDLANDLISIGINKRKLGAYQIADSFLQASLNMNKLLYKAPHPELAYNLNFLASSKQDISDYAAALPLAKEAYSQYRLILDSLHPELIASQGNLARIYSHLGYYDSAGILYEQAIIRLSEKYEDNHHYIGALMMSLGNVRLKQKKYKEAEILFLQGVENNNKFLSKGDVKAATGLLNLGNLYVVQGQYKKAYAPIKKACDIRMAALPAGHDLIGASQFALAKCLIGLKNVKEALPLLEKAEASLQSVPEKYKDVLTEIKQLQANASNP